MNFVTALLPLLTQLFGKAFNIDLDSPDVKVKLAEIAIEAEKQAQALPLAQIAVNKAEAYHPNLWVSGARPAMLWICASIFAYHYLLLPIIITTYSLYGGDVSHLPKFDMDGILYVLGGLLGLGSMRTIERIKGVIPNGR